MNFTFEDFLICCGLFVKTYLPYYLSYYSDLSKIVDNQVQQTISNKYSDEYNYTDDKRLLI